MSTAALRPELTAGDRHALLRDRLGLLVNERQSLQGSAAGPLALERNRQDIVQTQWELSRVLIELYAPQLARAAI